MTAVEWLLNELIFKQEYEHLPNNYFLMSDKDIDKIIEQANKMFKQQIIDAAERWKGTDFAEQYYNETYGSNGSDEHHEHNLNEIPTSSQTEISDEEIEEMLFHHSNEYAYGFKDAIKWYREQLKKKNL